jgi:hypothetical protein
MVEALLAGHAQNLGGVCEFTRRPPILHSTYPTHGTARQLDLWKYYIWKKLRVLDGRERSSAALSNNRQSHKGASDDAYRESVSQCRRSSTFSPYIVLHVPIGRLIHSYAELRRLEAAP